MKVESLESVKLWFADFKKELKTLPDTKGYIANCNIDWLIKEVEQSKENRISPPKKREGLDLIAVEERIAKDILRQLKAGIPVRSMDEKGIYDLYAKKIYITGPEADKEESE